MKQLNKLFLLTIVMNMMGLNVFSHDLEVANEEGVIIYYNIRGTELEVTFRGSSYNFYSGNYSGAIVIPETVSYRNLTYRVKHIGYNAFRECKWLTSVTIPNSVTFIGGDAFRDCSGLTSVTIPNSVTSIENYAFSNCSSLTSVSIPNSMTSISRGLFQECSRLSLVTIPSSVTTIGSGAFWGCSNLASVNIPNSVISIGSNAFYGTEWYNNQPEGLVYAGLVAYKYKGTMPHNSNISLRKGTLGIAGGVFSKCSGLTSITIPNSVTSIGESAFAGCSGLISVTIPDNVISIGSNAFGNCSGIKEVNFNANNCNILPSAMNAVFKNCTSFETLNIGNKVQRIPDYIFSDCSSLTSVSIPKSVTSIGERAFADCSGLSSVSIGNGVTSIGQSAFSNCTSLTSFTFPKGITSISSSAFSGCNLQSVSFQSKEVSTWFSGFSSIKKVTFEEGVETIDVNAFNNCTNLETIEFGSTVTEIGSRAFAGSDKLTDVFCKAIVVPKADRTTFEGSYVDYATLHVPAASIGNYWSTAPWNGFKNIVRLSDDTPSGEKVTATIGSSGMATFCSTSDLDFTMTNGLEAYTGAGFNRETGVLTMLKVMDAPAGTGLLLIGEEGTYEIPVRNSVCVYANLLVGVTEETTLAQTDGGYVNYILGNGSHGTGFYIVSGEGQLAAGKAYLRLPAAVAGESRAIGISFTDGTTGVDGLEGDSKTTTDEWRDLQGRRIEQPTKAGIYLKDGRKIVVR